VVSKYLTVPPCHYHAHQKRQQMQEQHEEQQQPSGQQKGTGQGQTFGQQTFTKNLDNALSSQQQEHKQQQQQQWNSNDDNLRADEARICARSSSAATDNDELLVALLNDFQLQSNRVQHSSSNKNSNYNNQDNQFNEPGPCCVFAISPKLLLNKLRLCHYNKYWLVQNKYAEVISNLNYVLLRSYYANFDSAFDNNNNNNNIDGKEDDKRQNDMPDACNWKEAAYNKDIVCTYEVSSIETAYYKQKKINKRYKNHKPTSCLACLSLACLLCRFCLTPRHTLILLPSKAIVVYSLLFS